MKPQFKIERGAVSFYFPAGNVYVHIRQGDNGTADVMIAYTDMYNHIANVTDMQLIDLLAHMKEKWSH